MTRRSRGVLPKFILLCVLALMLALPIAVWATQGDANGDSLVDHEDLVTVIHEIVDGTPSPSRANADMDGNGLVDLRDLAAIVDLILLDGDAPSPEAQPLRIVVTHEPQVPQRGDNVTISWQITGGTGKD